MMKFLGDTKPLLLLAFQWHGGITKLLGATIPLLLLAFQWHGVLGRLNCSIMPLQPAFSFTQGVL